jgi:hypothetical protein
MKWSQWSYEKPETPHPDEEWQEMQSTSVLDVEPLRIAPKGGSGCWTAEDWKVIKFTAENDWQEAITIFEGRIRGRFLDVVEGIQDYEFAGFAVMALDCLLIETLQQFYDGLHNTEPPIKDAFCRFLTQSSFKDHFDLERAAKFYAYIRNGILHQAEIKGSSRIQTRKSVPLVTDAPDGNGLILNRELFHKQLVHEFEDYVIRLRKSNPPDNELRFRFKAKMDAICDVESEKVHWQPCK